MYALRRCVHVCVPVAITEQRPLVMLFLLPELDRSRGEISVFCGLWFFLPWDCGFESTANCEVGVLRRLSDSLRFPPP